MKSECCHGHPDNGDLATQTEAQAEETNLRALNATLLAALEEASVQLQGASELMANLDDDSWASEKAKQCEAADAQARAAIEDATA